MVQLASFKAMPLAKHNIYPLSKDTTQWPKEKGQSTIYKTLHTQIKIEQYE